MKQTTRTYLLLEVERSKDIPDLASKAAGRVYSMPGVENATARLIDSHRAYELAKAQWEESYVGN